jgi:2,3-bisphosphoglycerate-independent phosphoglycerate mutase
MKKSPKVLLCILDGYGHGKAYAGNAITQAKKPFIDSLQAEHPWTLLRTSGEAVGIPRGNQGGSEVGHFTIGAGRIVQQPLLEINNAIKSGSFFKKKEFLDAIAHTKKKKSALHIVGMISDQGVHSNIKHGLALLELAAQHDVQRVYFHAITDGRDVEPQSAKRFLKMLQKQLKKSGGELATIIGRYYAMDRDSNLDRTKKAFDLFTKAAGTQAQDPLKAIDAAYASGLESDYYLEPIVLNQDGIMRKEDAVICFNFRSDRTKQITEMLLEKLKPYFVAFGPYTKSSPVAFPEPIVKNNLAQVLAENGKKQLRIAETEKYAHVTFFFNSQMKKPVKGEKRILIDSPKCPSYADKPEMSALKVTDALLKEIPKGHDFIALNFANPDLVGHSGDVQATVKAIETLDNCLSKIVPLALENDYAVLVTADHGNAEFMQYEDGGECASHSTNPVPFILVTQDHKKLTSTSHARATAGLKDIAPTVLKLLKLKKPSQMTGQSLV